MATLDYELWDLIAGNLMGAYPSQEAALAEVSAGIRNDGAEAWRDVGLRVFDERQGSSRPIASGNELIALAAAAQERGEQVVRA